MHCARRFFTAAVLVVVASGWLTWNASLCYALWESSTAVDTTLNIVTNGSFESGPGPAGYLSLNPGSTAITGWVVTRAQIDYVDVWQAYDGSRSIDLDGSPGFGGIGQTLSTVPGVEYRVTFAMAGNSHGAPEPKVLRVAAAGQAAVFSFDASGTTYAAMGWQQKTWRFVATGTTAFLEFYSLDSQDGTYGPALDSVTVRAVPTTVDTSVLALWHFDEGAGSVLHDASIYQNDGTIYNAAWVPGVGGTALRFDGLTSYVSGPSGPSLKPPRNFLIDAWFAIDTFRFAYVAPPDSGHGVVFSNLGPYPFGGGFQFSVRESGLLRSDYRVGVPTSRFSGDTYLSQTRHFYHVTIVSLRERVGADSMTVVRTFLDGVLTDSAAFSEQVQYLASDHFYIGTNIDGRAAGSFGIRDFPGVIDEILIRRVDTAPPDSARSVSVPLIIVNGTKSDTLYFGLQPGATKCLDPAFGEAELPPVPPAGVFDSRFIDPEQPPSDLTCLVLGTMRDYRGTGGIAYADTYRVRMQPGMAGYPFAISWPPLGDLYAGPVRMTDVLGGSIVDVDMKLQTSYLLANTLVRDLYIIAARSAGPPPPPPPPSPDSFAVPLFVSSGAVLDTLVFGVHPQATFFADPPLGELFLPPVPPIGVMDARFIEPRPEDQGTYFDLGVPVDLRPLVSVTQVDTYKVRFQQASGSFVTFTWPSLDSVYGGPVRLVDDISGSFVNVDMKLQNSYTVTNTLLHVLKIIAARGVDTTASTAFYRTFTQTDYAQRVTRRWRPGVAPSPAHVRDETFIRRGWYSAGLTIGIPRPDSTLTYGWVYFRRNLARLSRFVPHTGTPRGFDFYISGKPWHYSRANPAVKYHNNRLAGDQYALKFNVGASDAGITPPGFGELIFSDPAAPWNIFNGMTVRQLMDHTDSVLTFCRRYEPAYFLALDSCLSRINASFQGPITTFDPGEMNLDGARALSEVPFLHANPSAAPVIVPQAPLAEAELPTTTALYQNYPNPFNPATEIEFDLPDAAAVTLTVYNTLGQEIVSLLRDVPMDQGRQSVEFDGSGLPSGMYFYRLDITGVDEPSSTRTVVKKMLLLK